MRHVAHHAASPLAKTKFHQLFGGHGNKGIRLSCIITELDLKDIIAPLLNDCSNLATP
jgi:hypothetical protein